MRSNLGVARLTEAEYLAWEETESERHEFVNGEIIPISAASDAHSLLTINLTLALGNRLRVGPCRLRGESMRVHIAATGFYAYPDLSVVCGPPEFAPTRPVSLRNPSVIIEVLSRSTADYDLGAKAAHYRRCPSVRTLLFVDSRTRMVQRQERNADGNWTLIEQMEGDVPVLDVLVPMDEIYAEVELDREEEVGAPTLAVT